MIADLLKTTRENRMKKIGIFGDSFCCAAETVSVSSHVIRPGASNDRAWPNIIENKRGARLGDGSVECYAHGRQGTSLWYSFQKFLKHRDDYDQIIFGYTSHDRIPELPDDISQWAVACQDGPEFRRIIHELDRKEAGSRIKEVLLPIWHVTDMKMRWSADDLGYGPDDLGLYQYQNIFRDVNAICKKENITLINYMPYEDIPHGNPPRIDLSGATGPCITGIGNFGNLIKDRDLDWYNHLSKENNNALATVFLEILESNHRLSNSVITLANDRRFVKDN